jgi:hypothetical protein
LSFGYYTGECFEVLFDKVYKFSLVKSPDANSTR